MNNIIEVATGGIIIIIGLTAAYFITKLAGYWTTKRAELDQLIDESDKIQKIPYLDYLLKRVLNVVDDVVAALNNTMKKEILDATEDKKLTKEKGKRIRDKAVELVTKELPDSIWEELSGVVGDTEEFLKTLIEQSVDKQKYIELDEDCIADGIPGSDDDEDDESDADLEDAE